MQRRPHLLNLGILPRRMYAIRQQHHKKLPVRINPDRSPGEARMPEAVRRKIVPTLDPPSVGAAQPSVRVPPESCCGVVDCAIVARRKILWCA
jgi:hypothetical protein